MEKKLNLLGIRKKVILCHTKSLAGITYTVMRPITEEDEQNLDKWECINVDGKRIDKKDIYCYGVPEEYLFTAGFSWCTNEEAIIPNYFAPFEQKNTDIYFATSLWGEFDVFRGDADQDRPS